MTDELPGILGEIAAVAGVEAARKLAIAKGGRRVRIPGRLRPDCWLVECVGETAATKIVHHFRVINADGRPQGLDVELPIAFAGSIARATKLARETVARTIEEGGSVREAARRAGVTERAAWKMKSRLRGRGSQGGGGAQGSLF